MYTKYYIPLCCTFTYACAVLRKATSFAKANIVHGSCKMRVLTMNTNILIAIEGLLRLLPICGLIIVNVLVVRKSHPRKIFAFRITENKEALPENNEAISGQSGTSPNSLNSLQKALFLVSFCHTVRQIWIECTPINMVLLSLFKIVRYNVSAMNGVYHA